MNKNNHDNIVWDIIENIDKNRNQKVINDKKMSMINEYKETI